MRAPLWTRIAVQLGCAQARIHVDHPGAQRGGGEQQRHLRRAVLAGQQHAVAAAHAMAVQSAWRSIMATSSR
jgi:hypothetical protein